MVSLWNKPTKRRTRREEDTSLEQILAVDLHSETYTYSCASCVMESIRNRLNPSVRITADL
jgi:hypothetical protein